MEQLLDPSLEKIKGLARGYNSLGSNCSVGNRSFGLKVIV